MAEEVLILKHLNVRGVVQGVGFRPFVFRLAKEHGLKGWVINTSRAVEIEVEGPEGALRAFSFALEHEAPPLARIESVEARDGVPKGYTVFEIRESRAEAGYQLISPDIATCPDCLAELQEPQNRRYRYAFTNCTNCGPRFTIITDIPYDRRNTTMAKFTMCDLCRAEYDDVLNRRFHAQPNACPVCGPRVWIENENGNTLTCDDPIREMARLLRSGLIGALKGLGGFHLACDAMDSEVVARLRTRKGRPDKPFAVMMRDLEMLESFCHVTEAEADLLRSAQAPILLLPIRHHADVSPLVAPGNRYLGVMLPYTPIHHVLLRDVGLPLVMTSGNMSEEPIAKDNDEARERLRPLADFMLLHDREIYGRYDDSVFATVAGGQVPIRRARSYAPYPIKLPFHTKPLLAAGGEEKNTFCLARDQFAFVSQHIGDMENLDTLRHFADTIELYRKLFRIDPEVIAHDLHPDYLSTRYAIQFKESLPLVGVQHHHGHIASCMAENGLSGPVIGVAFDGSGFGLDGTVWGGEFLVGTYGGFQRMGHIEKMPLPGGEASIRRPYRLAFAYLYSLFRDLPSAPSLSQIDKDERQVITAQIEGRINTPLTSSCGRLFDAVSALLNVCRTISFEGQAAIALEMVAAEGKHLSPYPFGIKKVEGVWQVMLKELFQALLSDLSGGANPALISRRFHETVADIIREMTAMLSKETGIKRVVLSGGCFQNRLLLELTLPLLRRHGLESFTHRQVPCNDGGISLGQAAIAHATMAGEG
ncbi:MAG: carbamoyltransferase HypF [Syntrophorhabdales bacterium]